MFWYWGTIGNPIRMVIRFLYDAWRIDEYVTETGGVVYEYSDI